MQPLFRPMEGHHQHQHFGASFHHHDMAAHRMNSTPISDEDELDMDDSVSLSSNADGSCTSPANPLADSQMNGNFKFKSIRDGNGVIDCDLLTDLSFLGGFRRSFGQCDGIGWIGWIGRIRLGWHWRSSAGETLPHGVHAGAVGASGERVPPGELRVAAETLRAGRSAGPSRIHNQGQLKSPQSSSRTSQVPNSRDGRWPWIGTVTLCP